MLYQAQVGMATQPWLALVPGLAFLATTTVVNAAGEREARPAG